MRNSWSVQLTACAGAACCLAVLSCQTVAAQDAPSVESQPREPSSSVTSADDPRSFPKVLIVAKKRESALPPKIINIALPAESYTISDTPEAEPRIHEVVGVAGVGAISAPAYSGSNTISTDPIPFVDIHGLLKGRMFLSSDRGIGIYLLEGGRIRAGMALNYGDGRSSGKALRLKGLPDIGGAAEADGFAAYVLRPAAFELSLRRRLGASAGTQLELAVATNTAPLPRFHFSFGISLTWADSSFQREFYGVTAAQAARATALGNPLAPYTPKAGLDTLGMSLSGIYEVSRHWGLIGRVQVNDLVGQHSRHSPLTQRTVQPGVAVGVVYQF